MSVWDMSIESYALGVFAPGEVISYLEMCEKRALA